MSGLDVYRDVVSDTNPERCLAQMSNADLDLLIDALWQRNAPNDFQAQVFAMAVVEVLRRWRRDLKSEI